MRPLPGTSRCSAREASSTASSRVSPRSEPSYVHAAACISPLSAPCYPDPYADRCTASPRHVASTSARRPSSEPVPTRRTRTWLRSSSTEGALPSLASHTSASTITCRVSDCRVRSTEQLKRLCSSAAVPRARGATVHELGTIRDAFLTLSPTARPCSERRVHRGWATATSLDVGRSRVEPSST